MNQVLGGRGAAGYVLGRGAGSATVPSTLDTFTAANSTNINGRTPDTGKSGATWSVTTGAILIQSNTAQISSAPAIALIDCGRSDGALTLTNARIGSVGGGYVVAYWRWQDASNHWRLQLSPDRGAGLNDWFLQSVSGGTVATPASGEKNFSNYSLHTISVVLSGDSHTVSIDGSQIANLSSSHLATAQLHGFGFIGSAGQYVDSFSFTA